MGTPTSKLVRNERTKLLSTGLNNLGIATIVGGTLGPLIARSYGASTANGIGLPSFLGFYISSVRRIADVLCAVRAKGVGGMTTNEFYLWLLPPVVFFIGGAIVTFWPRGRRH